MGTYYDDLGLKSSATAEEIKEAYRILIKKFHPDRNPGREAAVKDRFIRIQKAYEVLSNPAKRRIYDATIAKEEFALAPVSTTEPFADINIRPRPQRKRKSNRSAIVWSVTASAFAVLMLGVLLHNQVHHEDKPTDSKPQKPFFSQSGNGPVPASMQEAPNPTKNQHQPEDSHAQNLAEERSAKPDPREPTLMDEATCKRIVTDYLLESVDDPDGLQIVKVFSPKLLDDAYYWSGGFSVDPANVAAKQNGWIQPGWWMPLNIKGTVVEIRYRAKNKFGALEIQEKLFCIDTRDNVAAVIAWNDFKLHRPIERQDPFAKSFFDAARQAGHEDVRPSADSRNTGK